MIYTLRSVTFITNYYYYIKKKLKMKDTSSNTPTYLELYVRTYVELASARSEIG